MVYPLSIFTQCWGCAYTSYFINIFIVHLYGRAHAHANANAQTKPSLTFFYVWLLCIWLDQSRTMPSHRILTIQKTSPIMPPRQRNTQRQVAEHIRLRNVRLRNAKLRNTKLRVYSYSFSYR